MRKPQDTNIAGNIYLVLCSAFHNYSSIFLIDNGWNGLRTFPYSSEWSGTGGDQYTSTGCVDREWHFLVVVDGALVQEQKRVRVPSSQQYSCFSISSEPLMNDLSRWYNGGNRRFSIAAERPLWVRKGRWNGAICFRFQLLCWIHFRHHSIALTKVEY